jgi:hypothetical protein
MCNTNTTRPYQLAINHYAHYAATSLKLNMNGTKHARSFWTQGNFEQVISNFQYIYIYIYICPGGEIEVVIPRFSRLFRFS